MDSFKSDLIPIWVYSSYETALEFIAQMTGEWVIFQFLAIACSGLCSFLLTRSVSNIIQRFIEGSDGHWLRDYKREIVERIAPIIFLAVLWIFLLVFHQVTWVGNTLILGTVAKLVTAWIVINILASAIRNRFFFRIVSFSLWILAALSILRILPQVTTFLDNTAFMVGDARISALLALKALGTIAILIFGVGFLNRLIDGGLRRSNDISASMKVLIRKLASVVLTIIAIVLGLTLVGIDLTIFAVFSGAVGIGIGFGLQKTISNFFSGIGLLLDKSIKPGDVISVGDTYGHIAELNTRYTSVLTPEGREHLIPNETLVSDEVINWSHSTNTVRISVPFGVSYEANPHLVQRVVAEAILKHNRVEKHPEPMVHFEEFGNSSLNFAARIWINDPGTELKEFQSDMNFIIWDVLKENGIEIPYPKRDLYAPDGISVRIER